MLLLAAAEAAEPLEADDEAEELLPLEDAAAVLVELEEAEEEPLLTTLPWLLITETAAKLVDRPKTLLKATWKIRLQFIRVKLISSYHRLEDRCQQ